MRFLYIFPSFLVFTILLIISPLTYSSGDHVHAAEMPLAQDENTKIEKGIHGGKLIKDGKISVEILMNEEGASPHFQVYVYYKKKLLSPKDYTFSMKLIRLDDDVDSLHFEKSAEEVLKSKESIREPHSFKVTISVNYLKEDYHFQYGSYEGRITLDPSIIQAAAIKNDIAKPFILQKKLEVVGKIVPNRNNMSPIYPRYPGVIKELRKNLGDTVKKGEVLAIIESNESLQNYEVQSPIAGTIVQKHVSIGEMVKEDKPFYEVADLSTVWADLSLYRKEASLIQKGMEVVVTGDEGHPVMKSVISYISPLGIEDSQTILARAEMPNPNLVWMPGMYVNASITYANKSASNTILLSALQRINDKNIIFIQKDNIFEATPVTLGERDDERVEVLSGLKPNQSYVSENSFFLKAELGKSSAEHDH